MTFSEEDGTAEIARMTALLQEMEDRGND